MGIWVTPYTKCLKLQETQIWEDVCNCEFTLFPCFMCCATLKVNILRNLFQEFKMSSSTICCSCFTFQIILKWMMFHKQFTSIPYTLLNSFTAGHAVLEDALVYDVCGTPIKLHSTVTLTFMQLLENLLM